MVATYCTVEFDGVMAGALAKDAGSPITSFEYTEDWLAGGFSLSPLYLPLQRGTFSFPNLAYDTYKGLPAVFADSLPDDFGNALIDAWLARRGLTASNFYAIDRLLYTGTRGMGALEYQPAIPMEKDDAFELDLSELVTLAQNVLDARNDFSATLSSPSAMTRLLQVGTSAGGARPKAVVAINDAHTHILSGQVDAPPGYTHYLLKFDGVEEHRQGVQTFGDPKGFGLMEYAYYLMAKACGIDMSPCDLLTEGDRQHFMTRRFDRIDNQKYHILTLCGMAHADFRKPGQFSYEQLLSVAREINLTPKEQTEIYRRMVFNVVARNHDDHTKNTSFYVDDNYEWALAPAYDMAWSYRPGSEWVDRHQMSINGKRDDFVRDDLLQVGKLISTLSRNKANQIIDNTLEVVSQWPDTAKDVGVFAALADDIARSHRLHL